MNYTLSNLVRSKQPVRMYLELRDGNVDVMADNGDDCWYIVSLTKDGKLEKCTDIPSHVGFKLDKRGCIVTVVEGV